VRDPAFLASEFFDARDVVQVKYEMVRRVKADGAPVTEAAAAFGYSRPSYYQAAAALERSGLEGLVPARPGPRGPHKLTGQILTWAEQQLAADPQLRPAQLAAPIQESFGVRAHPRTVEKALARRRESRSQRPLTCPPARTGRRNTRPCPCSPHPATRLLNRAPARMPARSPPPAAGWMPATSNCAMPPCTHAPRRSRSGSAC